MSVTNEVLQSMLLNITTQNADIKAQNEAIKSDLDILKNKFNTEVEELKADVEKLKVENLQLTKKVLEVEKKLRKNNIVIYGLNEVEGENLITLVTTIATDNLRINLSHTDINNVHRIGASSTGTITKKRPVLLELKSYTKKIELFKNAKQLKNSGIAIAEDLSPEERKDRAILLEHLKKAKSKNFEAVIRRNTLVVNGESYTIKDLKESEEIPEQESHQEYHVDVEKSLNNWKNKAGASKKKKEETKESTGPSTSTKTTQRPNTRYLQKRNI